MLPASFTSFQGIPFSACNSIWFDPLERLETNYHCTRDAQVEWLCMLQTTMFEELFCIRNGNTMQLSQKQDEEEDGQDSSITDRSAADQPVNTSSPNFQVLYSDHKHPQQKVAVAVPDMDDEDDDGEDEALNSYVQGI